MAEETQESNITVYRQLASATGLSTSMIAVIHNSVAKKTTTHELAYFLNVAKAAGLNPFMKEVWCYKDRLGNLLVFTGRDGFLKKAQQSEDYKGIQSAAVFENDEFHMITDTTNNEFTDSIKIYHKIKPAKGGRGELLGAYCISYREDKAPYGVWVELSRYNKGYSAWGTHPEDMIIKVAETHSLKKAFGINGVQSEYEYEVSNDIVEPTGKPVPVDKSEERIDKMISAAATKATLEKLKDKCTTAASMQAYEAKMKTFV